MEISLPTMLVLLLAEGAVFGAVCYFWGYTRGWRKGSELAHITTQTWKDRAARAEETLDDIQSVCQKKMLRSQVWDMSARFDRIRAMGRADLVEEE